MISRLNENFSQFISFAGMFECILKECINVYSSKFWCIDNCLSQVGVKYEGAKYYSLL